MVAGRSAPTIFVLYRAVRQPLRLASEQSRGYGVDVSEQLSDGLRCGAQIRAVLEAMPDPLLGVDGAGLIVFANRRAELAFGYSREDLVGHPAKLVLPELALDALTAASPPGVNPSGQTPGGAAAGGAAARGGGPLPSARRRDGSTFPVEFAVSVLPTDDGPVSCLAVRDISDLLRAHTEQARLRAEVQRQRVRLQLARADRLESLGRLAGKVAHDVNNLLGVIVNYAAFVIDEAGMPTPDRTSIAGDAEHILRAGERGSDLTRQLLSFARRELAPAQPVELNQRIAGLHDQLRRTAGEHITVSTSLSVDLPAVLVDPGQLDQVVLNLAANGCEAMPAGGALVLDTSEVTVEAAYATARPDLTPGRYVRLRVADCGTGMPPDVLEHAFEPFYTTKASGLGAGLGLATVYGVVGQARGTVVLESTPAFGTTVVVLLPIPDAPPAPPGAAPPPARGQDDGGDGDGRSVLVVTPEAALREFTGAVLSAAGYRVLSAEPEPDVVASVMAHAGPGALLLSDVALPGMPAGELVRQRPDIRVLHLSWHPAAMLAACGMLGPEMGLLDQPFTGRDLLHAVRGRLAGR